MRFREVMGHILNPFKNEPLFEMANLYDRHTGIADGLIFISSKMASHGPRIKWFPNPKFKKGPCLVITISDPPIVYYEGRISFRDVSRSTLEQLKKWIVLNKDKLLYFWNNGLDIDPEDYLPFINSLTRV